jgi:5'-nucleotidase (lipoprotein e(P4) family)
MKTILYFLLPLALLGSCSLPQKHEPGSATPARAESALTMATLFTYYAAEYDALCFQAYNVATERLENLKKKYPDKENMAVVLDLDETVLDNSPYQALIIEKDTNYPYMWNEWCNMARAEAVPGVMDFLNYADANGFHIFYLSNRKEKYVLEGTIKNMESLGMPQISKEHYYLRREKSDNNPDPSNKQGRRDEITAQGYEIVLFIGDNLGDFYTDEDEYFARQQQLNSYREDLGRNYIVLPNAMYGNWPSSIGIRGSESMDSLIMVMTGVFDEKPDRPTN